MLSCALSAEQCAALGPKRLWSLIFQDVQRCSTCNFLTNVLCCSHTASRPNTLNSSLSSVIENIVRFHFLCLCVTLFSPQKECLSIITWLICGGTPSDSHYQYHIRSFWPPGCIFFGRAWKYKFCSNMGRVVAPSTCIVFPSIVSVFAELPAIMSGCALNSQINKTSLITTSFENYHLGRIA